jgi:F0F1-type ATP synthase assembly protein I
MLEVLAPFAPFAVLLLYALAGSFVRLFYSMYKAYAAMPTGSVSPERLAMELLAGMVFGMVGGMLLDSMGVLKLGVGMGTVLCAILGPNAIELVAKKFGWTKKLEAAVVTDEQLQMPDLNARQINGLQYATRAKRLTNTAYQRLNNVSHDTAKRDLASMVEKGRLKAVGYNKSTYYVPKREIVRPDAARSAPR